MLWPTVPIYVFALLVFVRERDWRTAAFLLAALVAVIATQLFADHGRG